MENVKWTVAALTAVFLIGTIGTLSGCDETGKPQESSTGSTTASYMEEESASGQAGISNSNATAGQIEALEQALTYLSVLPFSYDGLIEQLEYEDFSHADAVYAANNCGADWKEQAVLKAESYLESSSFSYEGLVSQLEYEGFTGQQAKYGAANCGADWKEQAAKKAKSYLEIASFSREEMIEQLKYEGFTGQQALYGAKANGL